MRWKPARAGILNIWEYDEQTFDFGDGRLVLRGRNGSGKSNALALLFPFLLDGVMSAARMDPMGGARSMKSLLLGRDGNDGGGYQHDSGTGYLWMEFERGDERCTVGAGAAATVHRDADVWFFVTDKRVGDGLELTAGDVPIGRRQLAERLGNAAVFNTAEDYRQAVDRRLLGLGPARYRSLVDLLLTLRRPHLAGKLDTEHLSATLTAGLGELDTTLIDDVAHSFDDLDAMQQELEGLAASLDAVERFLPVYREHLIAIARVRADGVMSTAGESGRVEREQRATSARLETARFAETTAGDELTSATRSKAEIEARITSIHASDAYKSAAALDEVRKSAEEAARQSTKTTQRAETSARQANDAEQRRDSASEHLHSRESERDEEIHSWDELASAAGIAASLRPDSFDHDRAIALVVERRAQLRRVQELVESSAQAATRAELAVKTAEDTRQRAEEAARERERASDALEVARAALTEAWATWWTDIRALVERLSLEVTLLDVPNPDAIPDATRSGSSTEAPPPDGLVEDADITRSGIADSWLSVVDTALAVAVQGADAAVAEQEQLVAGLTEERRQVVEEPNPGPPPNPTRPDGTDDRTPGAPLYTCVDFAPELGESDRAGLESALDAAGLLDARITAEGLPDGSLDAAIVPRHAPTTDGPTLADVLVPTAAAGLDAAHIHRILQAIPLDSDMVQLAADGHWRLGPLAGRYFYPEARYIGHAARERRRAERLARLDEQIAIAESELEEGRSHAATTAALRVELRTKRSQQPATTSLRKALDEHRRRSDLAAQAGELQIGASRAADEASATAKGRAPNCTATRWRSTFPPQRATSARSATHSISSKVSADRWNARSRHAMTRVNGSPSSIKLSTQRAGSRRSTRPRLPRLRRGNEQSWRASKN